MVLKWRADDSQRKEVRNRNLGVFDTLAAYNCADVSDAPGVPIC